MLERIKSFNVYTKCCTLRFDGQSRGILANSALFLGGFPMLLLQIWYMDANENYAAIYMPRSSWTLAISYILLHTLWRIAWNLSYSHTHSQHTHTHNTHTHTHTHANYVQYIFVPNGKRMRAKVLKFKCPQKFFLLL